MTEYDVKCPHCGTENKGLYLDETDGNYICESCGKEHQIPGFQKPKRIPVYTGMQLAKLFATK